MLTFEDCLALCELTEEEVDAIAEHEQISETVAVELGSYLIHGPDGQLLIQRMIIDDIQAARRRGDLAHAAHLKQTCGASSKGTPSAPRSRSHPAQGDRLQPLVIALALAPPSASRSSSESADAGPQAQTAPGRAAERMRPAHGGCRSRPAH